MRSSACVGVCLSEFLGHAFTCTESEIPRIALVQSIGAVEDVLHASLHCPDYDLLRSKFSNLLSRSRGLYSCLCHSPVHRLAFSEWMQGS